MPEQGTETGALSEAPQWKDTPPDADQYKVIEDEPPKSVADGGDGAPVNHVFQQSPAYAFGTCPLVLGSEPNFFPIGMQLSFSVQGFPFVLGTAGNCGADGSAYATAGYLSYVAGGGTDIYPGNVVAGPPPGFGLGLNYVGTNFVYNYSTSTVIGINTIAGGSLVFASPSNALYLLNALGDGANSINDSSIYAPDFYFKSGDTVSYQQCTAYAAGPWWFEGPPSGGSFGSYGFYADGSDATTINYYAVPLANPSDPTSGILGSKILIASGSYDGSGMPPVGGDNNVDWTYPIGQVFDSPRVLGAGVNFIILLELAGATADLSGVTWTTYSHATTYVEPYSGPAIGPVSGTGSGIPSGNWSALTGGTILDSHGNPIPAPAPGVKNIDINVGAINVQPGGGYLVLGELSIVEIVS